MPLSVQICTPTSIKLCEIIFYLNCWFCFECASHSYLLVCFFPSPSSIRTVSCLLVFIRCSSFLLNAELVRNFLNLCFYFPQNNRHECWCDSNREYALIAIRNIFSFISFVFYVTVVITEQLDDFLRLPMRQWNKGYFIEDQWLLPNLG